jgi:hypothetical protein
MPADMVHDDTSLDAQTEAELAETGEYAEPDPSKPDPRRNYHVPLALLGAGIVLTFIDLSIGGGGGGGGAGGVVLAAIGTIIKLVFWSVVYTAGALLAVWATKINLGPLWPGMLKLAAVSVGPSALGDLVTTALGGDMAVGVIGGTIGLVTCWAMVSYLFRLDGGATMAVVGAIAIVKCTMMLVFGGLIMLLVSSLRPTPPDYSDDQAAYAEDGWTSADLDSETWED